MNVKQLRQFVSSRGITASIYNKDKLITLAKTIVDMNLIPDPDFHNDSMEDFLKKRLTLPLGKVLTLDKKNRKQLNFKITVYLEKCWTEK